MQKVAMKGTRAPVHPFLAAAASMALLCLVLQAAPRRGALALAAASKRPGKGAGAAFLPTTVLPSVYNSNSNNCVGGGARAARRQVAAAFFSSSSSASSSWGLISSSGSPRAHQCPSPRGRGGILASVLSSSSSGASTAKQAAAPAVVRVMGDGEGGIKKPARDDRHYRMLWLKNGMQVSNKYVCVVWLW